MRAPMSSPTVFLALHNDFFFSRFAFIASQPCSSSSSEALPALVTEMLGCWIAPDMVEDFRRWPVVAAGGTCETGRYRPGRPMLLRSDGAMDGAYPPPW